MKEIKKSAKKRVVRTKKFSSTRMLFLSVALLFIIFEALFILKNQQQNSVLSQTAQKQVAGASTQK